MMASRGSWCRFEGGEDIGAVVRGGASLLSSNPFHHFFTGSLICDDQNKYFTDKKVFFSSKKEDLSYNVCSTASYPRQEFLQISPKRKYIDESPPKDIGVKSEPIDQTTPPSKICTSPRPTAMKRRRKQERSMACIPMAEGCWNKQGGAGVASDIWSWRKYGQKPIKGSPYPRGYYRCSSSKGCPARKQVERSRTDPTMVLITYTADHNHASPSHRRAVPAQSSSFSKLRHDKKENSLSLEGEAEAEGEEEEEALSLSSVPDAAIATEKYNDNDHDHGNLSPPSEGDLFNAQHPHPHPQKEKEKEKEEEATPNYSDCLHNNSLLDEVDQQLLITANNHMIFQDDLFHTFDDFPTFLQTDFGSRSWDEEDDCRMGDAFNLFDWSFSSNSWPNS